MLNIINGLVYRPHLELSINIKMRTNLLKLVSQQYKTFIGGSSRVRVKAAHAPPDE